MLVTCIYEPRGDDCLEGFDRGELYRAEEFLVTKGKDAGNICYNLRDHETNNWMGTCTKRQLKKYFEVKKPLKLKGVGLYDK